MKKKLFKRSVWTLLTVFFAFLLAIAVVVQQIAASSASWIDDYFGATRYRLVEDGAADGADAQYFKSPYSTLNENGEVVFDDEAMRAHSLDVDERVAEEGAVLLWNRDGALPLAAGDRITAFGVASAAWQYTGYGSGQVAMASPPDLKESLESRGLQVNSDLFAVMDRVSRNGYGVNMGKEIPWDVLGSTPMGSVADVISGYGDAAIFTVARISGEGADIDAGSTALTEAEHSVLAGLAQLKAQGVIKKIILLFNTPNAMSLRGLKEYDIDACLWVGYGGGAATDAVADLLVGNANPSGHLTDTWVYDVSSAPSSMNIGDFTFLNSEGLPVDDGSYPYKSVSDKYVVYLENIYVGYRYYETRYEDSVLGGRNAGSAAGSTTGGGWRYADEAAYPFGYGLSYTTFEYSGFSVEKADGGYQVTVTVRNTGSVPGKEVVQVYLQKPYTDYDRRTGIEKAAVELVGFTKTALLGPGESQTVTVPVSEYEFKSYDSYGYKTYILEKGDYYLSVGTDAHNALNNILAAKGYTTANGMDAAGDGSFVYCASYAEDDVTTYAVSPFTGKPVTNQFDDTDVNLYEGLAGQTVTYLSRSDWEGTYPTAAVLSADNEKLIADMQYGAQVPNDPADEMPVYGTVTSPYGHLNLIQLMDMPYDDPMWDDLLNQLTFSEQVDLLRSTLPGLTSIAAPNGGGQDGPCGLNLHQPEIGMPFPCDPIVASTFNVELIQELGEAFGLEILHNGNYAGIYGPGANVHRNAICGRTWEYYSEDGFLSGKINAAEVRGLRSVGIVPFTKHFALNEQETNRFGLMVWANEQSIREIYLKAFEGGITEGDGNGLMTSYSRIGCTWSGRHYGLLTGVLRNEWGFLGVTVTGWPGGVYMGANSSTSGAVNSIFPLAVMAGQDMWLSNMVMANMDGYADNPTVCQALRETAHRALYTLLHSKAMNGVSSNTRVVAVTPLWEAVLVGVTIGSGVLTAACLAMTLASWIVWTQERKRKRNP